MSIQDGCVSTWHSVRPCLFRIGHNRPLDAAPLSTSVTSRIISSFSTESTLTYTFYFYWVGKHPKKLCHVLKLHEVV